MVMSHAAEQLHHEHDHAVDHAAMQSEDIGGESTDLGRTDRPYVSNWLDENSFARGGGDVDTRTSDAFDDGSQVRADTTVSPIASLMQKQPTTTRGPNGYAQWLRDAIALKLVSVDGKASLMAKEQLADLAEGRPVKTYEFHNEVTPAREKLRRQQTGKKLDDTHRVSDWEWTINMQIAPILETLVAVVKARVKANGGAKSTVLHLGQFVRADMWFDPPDGPSGVPIHSTGSAVDLFFVGKTNGAEDVLHLLEDLPPGKIEVFRDTDSALHLDRRAGGYGLGVPAMGDYLPPENAIDPKTGRCPAQKRAETDASDHSRPLVAKGIKNHNGHVFRSTATWQNGAWQWSTWSETSESLVDYIQSAKLREALENFGTPKKT